MSPLVVSHVLSRIGLRALAAFAGRVVYCVVLLALAGMLCQGSVLAAGVDWTQITRLPAAGYEVYGSATPADVELGGYESNAFPVAEDYYGWHLLPEGLIYSSYLAGVKEPRMGAAFNFEDHDGWKWDLVAGGRVGIIRHGSSGGPRPSGWQLDVEGAAFIRLDPEVNAELEGTDYRFGLPVSWGNERHQTKVGYYHLSSHLGDEYALRNGLAGRLNYSRDVLLWGQSFTPHPDWRFYAETGWAFKYDVAKPWEFQFGIDYNPMCRCGFRGAPFAAVNAHLREELDFSGNFVAQAGWQWRSAEANHQIRVGLQYYNGKHEKMQFYTTSENKLGVGIWYDF